MRKIRIEADTYSSLKTKFKKWMKTELGFIWTGHFNHEDPKNSLIQWKSSNTTVESDPVWDDDGEEKICHIFSIDGIDEDKVANHLLEFLNGTDLTSEEDMVKSETNREELFQKEINEFIYMYHPKRDDKMPDSLWEFKGKEWEIIFMEQLDILDTKYYGTVSKTEEEEVEDILSDILK